jgi:hypothetical protein
MSLQLAPQLSFQHPIARWRFVFAGFVFCAVNCAYYIPLSLLSGYGTSYVPLIISGVVFLMVMLGMHYRGATSRFQALRVARALILAAIETAVLTCLTVVIIVTLQALDFGRGPANPMPNRLLNVINAADDVTLYSALELYDGDQPTLAEVSKPTYYASDVMYGGEKANGASVLGHTDLGPVGKFIATRLVRQMSGDGGKACIMSPRHTLRFKSQGHAYYISICYQCGMVSVHEDSKRIGTLDTDAFPKPIFDAMLWFANVPSDFKDLSPAQLQVIGARHVELMAEVARKDAEAAKRWVASTPASVQNLVAAGYKLPLTDEQKAVFSIALEKQYPDQNVRMLALLNWLGADSGNWQFSRRNAWSPLYEKIGLVLALMESTDRQTILDAMQSRAMTPQEMEGALRAMTLHRTDGGAYTQPYLPAALKQSLLAHLKKESAPENEYDVNTDLVDEGWRN